MGDVDAVRKLAQLKAAKLAKRYQRLLNLVRRIIPDCELTDMGAFHLLRLANVLRTLPQWDVRRSQLNKLLEAAGNPERLPELPSALSSAKLPDGHVRWVETPTGLKAEVYYDES